MLRSLLLYLSTASWMKSIMMNWGIARRVALRFVAGETLDEAIEAIKVLNQKGMNATLDQLGEDTNTPDEARQTGEEVIAILEAIEASGVRSSVSLKLTQIGLALDENLCLEILADIIKRARELNNYVRIDMEDYECLEATMRIYRKLREMGFDNVGLVMQSYLYRAEEDTRELVEMGCGIRMVKGAYKEPPEVAYPKKKDVDTNFDVLMEILIDAALSEDSPPLSEDGKFPPVPIAATHDEKRVAYSKAYAEKVGLPKEKLEFQMLHGIRRELQEQLVAEGLGGYQRKSIHRSA